MWKKTKIIENPNPDLLCKHCWHYADECDKCHKVLDVEDIVYCEDNGIRHLCEACMKKEGIKSVKERGKRKARGLYKKTT